MYFLEAARSRRRGSAGRLARELSGWLGRTGVLKAEYLYYDLGTVSNNFDSVRTTPGFGNGISNVASQSTTRFNGNIVRLGVNLHF